MKHLLFGGVFIIAVNMLNWVVFSPHSNRASRCSLDGSQIQPLYEVIIGEEDKSSRKFSCVLSARIWFRENSEQVSSIVVTDEATGKKIRAEEAFYAVSEVVTTPYTGSRTHVFADESKARSHARQFNGKLIKNPFQPQEKKPVLVAKHRPDLPNCPGVLFPSSQNPLSLPAKSVLMNQQYHSYLPQEYHARLSDGYLSPLYRPPRTFT